MNGLSGSFIIKLMLPMLCVNGFHFLA